MKYPPPRLAIWRPTEATLLSLTLIAATVHFVDNALHFDLYPGPAWLTRKLVFAAWIVVLLAACVAYRINTQFAFISYGLLGFIGLAHFVVPHAGHIPTRCTFTIAAEAVTSLLLITYSVLRIQTE